MTKHELIVSRLNDTGLHPMRLNHIVWDQTGPDETSPNSTAVDSSRFEPF